ncbi:MAG: hypothetical protein DMF86_00805 [Acidobacteria bacterium]|nr:MAG: hypothetical protein DMF86_00805 [Acidobacteriota bacterium]
MAALGGIHPCRRQHERDALRARHPHLRELHAQHARHLGDSGRAEAEPPAGARRSEPRHRTAGQGCADGACGGGGGRGRPADRGALRSGSRAERRRAVDVPQPVRPPHGGAAHHRARDRAEHLPRNRRAEGLGRVIPLTPAKPPAPVFERVAIVGFGLIGGSIGLAARARWPTSLVIAVDNKAVIEEAMRRGAADVGGDSLVMAGEADLVILAAPVLRNIALLRDLPEYLERPAIVTDVGSTKRAIVDAARGLPSHLTFVGGHPFAGAARGGFRFAQDALFNARPWFLTPADSVPGDAVQRLSDFIRELGGEPVVTSADAHDRLLAYLSHLPQLAASALMQVIGAAAGEDGVAFAGRGLSDTTRLASSPPDIWRDIASTNADEIGAALDVLIAQLQKLRGDLTAGNRLEEIFREAARWREKIPNP